MVRGEAAWYIGNNPFAPVPPSLVQMFSGLYMGTGVLEIGPISLYCDLVLSALCNWGGGDGWGQGAV